MDHDFALLTFWLVVGVIAIAGFYFRHATQASKNEVIKTLVEKGQPIPPDLFKEVRRPWHRRAFVAAGILLLGAAAATLVFFLALTSKRFGGPAAEVPFLPFISAFPFCIGIACLAVGRYLKPHD